MFRGLLLAPCTDGGNVLLGLNLESPACRTYFLSALWTGASVCLIKSYVKTNIGIVCKIWINSKDKCYLLLFVVLLKESLIFAKCGHLSSSDSFVSCKPYCLFLWGLVCIELYFCYVHVLRRVHLLKFGSFWKVWTSIYMILCRIPNAYLLDVVNSI